MASAGTGMEPFQHERLSDPRTSIRIVLLQPARSASEPVQCILKEVKLEDANGKRKFEALSYVWAPRPQLRFSGKSRERALWIDTICIDQTQNAASTAERNRQVELMGEIYAKASKVIVWLGPATSPHVEEMFKRLRFIARWSTSAQRDDAWFDPRRYMRGVTKYITDSGDRGFAKRRYGGEIVHRIQPYYDVLYEILANPWFQRVWTVQEVAMAQDCVVMLGTSTIGWSQFVKVLALSSRWSVAHEKVGGLIHLRSGLQDLVRHLKRFQPSELDQHMLLLTWLLMGATLESGRAIDRAYGLYGIMQRFGIASPPVDYTRPTRIVLEETAVMLMKAMDTNSLYVLESTIGWPVEIEVESDSLPTWLPTFLASDNYSSTAARESMFWKGRISANDGREHQASGESPPYFHYHPDLNKTSKLSLRGKVVDAVYSQGGHPTSFTETLQQLILVPNADQRHQDSDSEEPMMAAVLKHIAALRRWCEIVSSSFNSGIRPINDVLDDFFTLLTQNIRHPNSVFDKDPKARFQAFLELFDLINNYPHCKIIDASSILPGDGGDGFLQIITVLTKDEHLPHSHKPNCWQERVAMFHDEIVGHLMDVTLFVTEQGLLGRTYVEIEKGDKLVLLSGCRSVMILREAGENYGLIGPAFVVGMTNGEMWDTVQDDLDTINLI